MKKHLILTGRLYGDYTELIIKVLAEKMAYAGGFITRNGSERGSYNIAPCACAAGIEMPGEECFLRFSGEAVRNNDAFRNYGAQLVEQAKYYPFAVLDVLGGFELIIPQFKSALDALLSEDMPVIAYLICLEDVKNIQRLFGLSDKFYSAAEAFHQSLFLDGNTEIINTQNLPEDEITGAVLQWKKEYT